MPAPRTGRPAPNPGRLRTRFAAAAAALLLAGCGPIDYEAGSTFNPAAALAALRPGQATEADVRAALGPPYGTGRTMMPYHDSPRLTWTYFYDRGSLDLGAGHANEELRYLFLFFKNDRLDSYLWFNTAAPG